MVDEEHSPQQCAAPLHFGDFLAREFSRMKSLKMKEDPVPDHPRARSFEDRVRAFPQELLH